MGHPSSFGATPPALQEPPTGIDNPNSVGRHLPLTHQTRGDVNAVDTPSDDEPIKGHGSPTF